MTDRFTADTERTLMHEMRLTPENIERRKAFVGLNPDDRVRIVRLTDVVHSHVDALTATFFDFLVGRPEAKALLDDRDLLERARTLKREHLLDMVRGEYGAEYFEQRLKLGRLYSDAGLDPCVFLGAFHHLLAAIGSLVMSVPDREPLDAFHDFLALKKVAFVDIGLVVDVLIFVRERVIFRQQEAIREMSTPVLQVRDGLLIIPVVGLVDTHRARLLTEGLLKAIRERRAKGVVMDITGVPIVDSRVANHLAQACEAARLMGALVVLTGISPRSP